MKIILPILIIFFLSINYSNANLLPWEKSTITNWNLLYLKEIYKNKNVKINSIDVNVNFLKKSIVKNYTEKTIYKKIKTRLKDLWYIWSVFDYANAKEKWKLKYIFHNKQEYSITNNSNQKEKFLINFYPITPNLQKYPSEFLCIKKSNSVILNQDYWVINLKLSSKNKGKIKFRKKWIIQKDLNWWDWRQWICDEAEYFGYSIYFYYQAKIILDKNKTDILTFSYDSLNYYNSNINTPWNSFLSTWVSDWSPQETTWIPISFKINIPNNFNLYKINKAYSYNYYKDDNQTKVKIENQIFKFIRYNLFQIIKK